MSWQLAAAKFRTGTKVPNLAKRLHKFAMVGFASFAHSKKKRPRIRQKTTGWLFERHESSSLLSRLGDGFRKVFKRAARSFKEKTDFRQLILFNSNGKSSNTRRD